jgi:hypothetical protein
MLHIVYLGRLSFLFAYEFVRQEDERFGEAINIGRRDVGGALKFCLGVCA